MKQLLSVHPLIWPALTILVSCSSPTDYHLSYSWSPVEIGADVEGSEAVEAIIVPYRTKMDSMMNEVIGYAKHELTTHGKYESTLGTFVTELLLIQSISSFNREVDVAIMNHHGGLRAPINQGPITLGDVFEVMPFENEMILLEIPGDSLTEIIKFVGKSGRSMIWPVSFHVYESGIEDIRINGEAIQPDRNYILSVSDYMANGGAGFQMLRPLKRLAVTPVKLRDMIVQEIRQQTAKGDSIDTEVANLITVSNPNIEQP